MINLKELRKENTVEYKGLQHSVVSINGSYIEILKEGELIQVSEEYINPVPLKESFELRRLVNMGSLTPFGKYHYTIPLGRQLHIVVDKDSAWLGKVIDDKLVNIGIHNYKYIHELENLYQDLTQVSFSGKSPYYLDFIDPWNSKENPIIIKINIAG